MLISKKINDAISQQIGNEFSAYVKAKEILQGDGTKVGGHGMT